MSLKRRWRTTSLDDRTWQRRVWARIALDRVVRARWRRRTDSDIVSPGSENMTEEPQTPAVAVARVPLARRSRLYRLICRLVGIGVCAAAINLALADRREECAAAVRSKQEVAVPLCKFEYQRSRVPAAGALLAEAYFNNGEHASARELAVQLLATAAEADARYILGRVAQEDDDLEGASAMFEAARVLYRVEGRARELARDDGLLSMVRVDRGEFAKALQLIDECITQAQAASDVDAECVCHLAAANAFERIGHVKAAVRELDLAEKLAVLDVRKIDVAYRRASLSQETGDHALAIVRFENAIRERRPSQHSGWIVNAKLNLAYSLIEDGYLENGQLDEQDHGDKQRQLEQAQQHIEEAKRLDQDNEREAERAWVSAQLAYRRRDFAGAAALVDEYRRLRRDDYKDPEHRDDQIDVAVLGAQIELARNELEQAKEWARYGVSQIERMRGTQDVLELRPWVLAKRRAAYELYFTALARSEPVEVEAAAMVFDRWQGRAVQDALASRLPQSHGYGNVATEVNKLSRWLHVASEATFARDDDRAAVLRTMRRIDLVALVVANGEVWRLVASQGPPGLFRIASLKDIVDDVGRFQGRPSDAELAEHLGALLLPEDAFRKTSEVLHVVLDARLAGLPVAALRHRTGLLIKKRPIVYSLRLPERHCEPVDRKGRATVLGDPPINHPGLSRLPDAGMEIREVAESLRTTSKLEATSKTGTEATKAALFDAAGDAVLHVVTHGTATHDTATRDTVDTDPRTRGAGLVLADGEVYAMEIPLQRVAPSLVFLAACDGATSPGIPELSGSLVAGFLSAGSQHVIAMLGEVSDEGGRKISTSFYRADGVADPPRALFKVLAALAEAENTENTDWAKVVVFGPQVCTAGVAGHP